jgi:hypothetical protein
MTWGGQRWSLTANQPNPGLSCPTDDGCSARLLALDRLSEAGRSQPGVFGPASLLGFELHRSWLRVTFAPAGWGGAVVRAGWAPGPKPDTIDLEVQVTASSVGQLQNLEVGVASTWPVAGDEVATGWTYRAEPRDVRSAALSYDGREADPLLRALTTGPAAADSDRRFVPRTFAPSLAANSPCYVEMVQPDDAARRITGEASGARATQRQSLFTRYSLFGHDLEKGVVLRARLRGQWLPDRPTDSDLAKSYREFLAEALPLGP